MGALPRRAHPSHLRGTPDPGMMSLKDQVRWGWSGLAMLTGPVRVEAPADTLGDAVREMASSTTTRYARRCARDRPCEPALLGGRAARAHAESLAYVRLSAERLTAILAYTRAAEALADMPPPPHRAADCRAFRARRLPLLPCTRRSCAAETAARWERRRSEPQRRRAHAPGRVVRPGRARALRPPAGHSVSTAKTWPCSRRCTWPTAASSARRPPSAAGAPTSSPSGSAPRRPGQSGRAAGVLRHWGRGGCASSPAPWGIPRTATSCRNRHRCTIQPPAAARGLNCMVDTSPPSACPTRTCGPCRLLLRGDPTPTRRGGGQCRTHDGAGEARLRGVRWGRPLVHDRPGQAFGGPTTWGRPAGPRPRSDLHGHHALLTGPCPGLPHVREAHPRPCHQDMSTSCAIPRAPGGSRIARRLRTWRASARCGWAPR